jgi:hypothetical protein
LAERRDKGNSFEVVVRTAREGCCELVPGGARTLAPSSPYED